MYSFEGAYKRDLVQSLGRKQLVGFLTTCPCGTLDSDWQSVLSERTESQSSDTCLHIFMYNMWSNMGQLLKNVLCYMFADSIVDTKE